MFRLKIIVMAIFTEICSFRLNVVQDTNVVHRTIFHCIFIGQIEFITKICAS